MAVRIGSNISALKAQRQLGRASESLSTTFERLASGQRINRASDDAAGLAIASSLSAQGRVYTQALRNINDGVSLLSIGASAAQELKGILTRVLEVAEQSANGTYGSEQRRALDQEVTALQSEYNRIIATTQFNGIQIFDDASDPIVLQVGKDGSGILAISLSARVSEPMPDGTFSFLASQAISPAPDDTLLPATGDFNGDGEEDLLIARNLYEVDLWAGNGNGTFSPRVLAGGAVSAIFGLSAHDFDGDGKLDYALGDSGTNTVRVFRGNGDGTFQPFVSYSAGTEAYLQAVQDIDLDGYADLVTTSFTDSNLSVLLSNGDGTFAPRISMPIVYNSPAFGDFDGDGKVDLVTVLANTRYLHSGNGDGTFGASVSSVFTGSNSVSGVYVADINNDGKLDLVGRDTGLNQVVTALGNGNGTFSAGITIPTATASYSGFFVRDVNGDDNIDIVYASRDNGRINTLLGNGNGTFQATISSSAGAGITNIAFSDMNGDGVSDVVSVSGASDMINVFAANTTGSRAVKIEPISGLSVSTRANALATLTAAQGYLDDVNTVVGVYGANLSRLQTASAVVSTTVVNGKNAESRIRDADIAEESSNLTRGQILRELAAAVLGQANLQPGIAVSLLS